MSETGRESAAHLMLTALLVVCFSASSIQAQELPTRVAQPQVSQLRVELSMEDPPPLEPGRPLRFVARAEPADKRLEYHFYFGDGHASGWVRENQVRHAYANMGAFQAVVFARETAPEGTPARPSIRSNRVPITIVPQAEQPKLQQPKPQQPVVRLEILPPELRPGESVQARAYLDPAMERVEYRFDFGDGEPAAFQPETALEHRYAAPGMYEAFVQVQQGNRLIAESERVRIAVAPVLAHRLLLEVDRRNPLAGQAVRFSWRLEPHAPDVLYLVDFGDGNQSPQGAQSPVEHVYAEPREYRALLRARIGTEEVISNEVLVSVSPVDRDNLYMLIALIGAAIGVLLAAWLIIRRIRTKKETSAPDTHTLLDPSIRISPHKDSGSKVLEFGSPAKPPLEVRLNPVSDSGRQIMDQGTAARKKKGVSHE